MSRKTMGLHRTPISSRSSCAIPLLTAAVLTKLPGQPARRLEPQPINIPPRRARKLMPSTPFSASRLISLRSPLWGDQGNPVTNSGPVSSSSSSGASSPQAPNSGKCSTPEINFATGLDGRKETAFAPVYQVSYNRGSADNIGVITQLMCDALANTCGANQATKDLCTRAESEAADRRTS